MEEEACDRNKQGGGASNNAEEGRRRSEAPTGDRHTDVLNHTHGTLLHSTFLILRQSHSRCLPALACMGVQKIQLSPMGSTQLEGSRGKQHARGSKTHILVFSGSNGENLTSEWSSFSSAGRPSLSVCSVWSAAAVSNNSTQPAKARPCACTSLDGLDGHFAGVPSGGFPAGGPLGALKGRCLGRRATVSARSG
jgi:hypothetical protein